MQAEEDAAAEHNSHILSNNIYIHLAVAGVLNPIIAELAMALSSISVVGRNIIKIETSDKIYPILD